MGVVLFNFYAKVKGFCEKVGLTTYFPVEVNLNTIIKMCQIRDLCVSL